MNPGLWYVRLAHTVMQKLKLNFVVFLSFQKKFILLQYIGSGCWTSYGGLTCIQTIETSYIVLELQKIKVGINAKHG